MVREDSYSNSAPLLDMENRHVATLLLEQKIRTFELDGSCDVPVGKTNEISLLIRNQTTCQASFGYRLSVFQGQTGRTIEGTASILAGATEDRGVVIRNLEIRVDQSQMIVTGSDFAFISCGAAKP